MSIAKVECALLIFSCQAGQRSGAELQYSAGTELAMKKTYHGTRKTMVNKTVQVFDTSRTFYAQKRHMIVVWLLNLLSI